MSSSNKVVIKLGPDFQGAARLINTMVWGDPSTLAQVDNGSLWLLGLHATQYGDGLQIRQGEVTAVNVNYTGRGNRSAVPAIWPGRSQGQGHPHRQHHPR